MKDQAAVAQGVSNSETGVDGDGELANSETGEGERNSYSPNSETVYKGA